MDEFDRNVFLNVPFDKSYERLFVALIAALVCVGRRPKSVLEITDTGQGRLDRIQGWIEQCRVSIHDLSRVGVPVRFNMPFELGLACSLRRLRPPHEFIILEKEQHRLIKTLSDIKSCDPYIHNNSPNEIVNCVLNALGSPSKNTPPDEVYKVSSTLWKAANRLREKARLKSLFTRMTFYKLVDVATQIAVDKKLLKP